jgi:hypothetical protein
MAAEAPGRRPTPLWLFPVLAIVVGWVAIMVASLIVLYATHWLNGIGSFPIDTVASIMACWLVCVLFAVAVWEAIRGAAIQVSMPAWRPHWWAFPVAGLIGLALGWAFWR